MPNQKAKSERETVYSILDTYFNVEVYDYNGKIADKAMDSEALLGTPVTVRYLSGTAYSFFSECNDYHKNEEAEVVCDEDCFHGNLDSITLSESMIMKVANGVKRYKPIYDKVYLYIENIADEPSGYACFCPYLVGERLETNAEYRARTDKQAKEAKERRAKAEKAKAQRDTEKLKRAEKQLEADRKKLEQLRAKLEKVD